MNMCENYLTKNLLDNLQSKFLQVNWDGQMPPL